MATNNNTGTALAPIGATKAVSPSPIARDQQVAFAIAAMPSRKGETYTAAELLPRLLAAGVPLALPCTRADWSFMRRNARPIAGVRGRKGTTHEFANNASKGASEHCVGHDGDTCATVAKSAGDGVTRYAHDAVPDYASDALPADAKAVDALARKAWASHVAYLRNERKASDADMLATRAVATFVNAGFALPPRKASKPAADKPARARKASNKPAMVAPSAD